MAVHGGEILMSFCPYCGKPKEEVQAYCPHCGKRPNGKSANEKEKIPVPRPSYFLLGLLGIVFVSGILLFCDGYPSMLLSGAGNTFTNSSSRTAEPSVKTQNSNSDQLEQYVKGSLSISLSGDSRREEQRQFSSSSSSAGLIQEDLVLSGIELGISVEQAKGILGNPIKVQQGTYGILYTFGGVELTVINISTVGSVNVESVSVSTRRGIRVGDAASDVIRAYGTPTISSYGNQELYEYTLASHPAKILRFAVDKASNKVAYIGTRLSL